MKGLIPHPGSEMQGHPLTPQELQLLPMSAGVRWEKGPREPRCWLPHAAPNGLGRRGMGSCNDALGREVQGTG